MTQKVFALFSLLFLPISLIAQSPKPGKHSKPAITAEKGMAAYLFVFFDDSNHSLCMATSYDGYSFTAVNNGKPVISGDTIADQKGIRDPHIGSALAKTNGCLCTTFLVSGPIISAFVRPLILSHLKILGILMRGL